MFGFGRVDGLNRKEYNNRVRNILENRFTIVTDHDRNPMFPGILMFGQLMDEGWVQKCCPEDNAVYIALRYWSGTAKAGGTGLQEARRIDNTVRSFLLALRQSGKISEVRGQQFQTFYDDHRRQLQVDQANEAPYYIGHFMEAMKIKNDLIAQGEYLSNVFNAIREHLATDYPHIGADELEATRLAYRWYIVAEGAGLPTFDKQRYLDATEKMFAELGALRDVFANQGLDITELWQPFVQGILEEIDLVEKLEG